MATNDPLPRLAQMVAELHRHPDVIKVEETGPFVEPDNPAMTYDDVWQMSQDAAAAAVPGCVLDPALRPLADRLAATDGWKVGVSWRYRLDGKEHNGGEFCWDLLWCPPDPAPQWWDDCLSPEERELHERLCVLEWHPSVGNSVTVMLELRSDAATAPLWLEKRGELHPMTIGITEYLERTMETRGLFGWQALFCDWQGDRRHFDLLVDPWRFVDFQRLFPDVDYEPYLRRYDEMWRSMS